MGDSAVSADGQRVLQVVTDCDRRGAQVYATDLAVGLAALGCDVETVALAPGQHGERLDLPVLGPGPRSLATFRNLRRRARTCDVVVAHGSSTLLACAVSLIGLRTPFVYRQISDPLRWAGTWGRRLRVAAFLRRSRHVVALSHDVADVFSQHYWLRRDMITVIPNAVPESRFHPPDAAERLEARSEFGISSAEVVAVTVGSLSEEKGVDLAIESLVDVPQAVLLVAGDGPDREALQALADERLGDRVQFVGPISDVRAVYWAADLLIAPSRSESMPAVVIEAGLCGLPVVASDVGAVSEIVIDGVTGYLTKPGDVSALRSVVSQLAENREAATTLGSQASVRCSQRFTIESTSPKWKAVLARVGGCGL